MTLGELGAVGVCVVCMGDDHFSLNLSRECVILFLLLPAFPVVGPSVEEGRESTELHLAMGMCAIIGPGESFFVYNKPKRRRSM